MGWVSKPERSGKYLVNRTESEVAGLPIEIGFLSSSDKLVFEFYSGGGVANYFICESIYNFSSEIRVTSR